MLMTAAGYAFFASSTGPAGFGLDSARHPERWAAWRYLIVAFWLASAYAIHLLRHRRAFGKSLSYALATSGTTAFSLAGIWIEINSEFAVLGTASIYAAIAGLLCMSLRSHVLAGVLAVVSVVVRIAVDVVVLGLAGQFRLH